MTLFSLNLEISTYQEKHIVVLIKEIINIIIQDDYNELVAFLTKHPEINIHARIQIPTKEPLYQLVNDESISFIDLCCLFGSIHCFKYFLINQCKLSFDTEIYCIIGGNYEIIQILNQQNSTFDGCIKTSIRYHQYFISDWLLANYETQPIFADYCIENYNFQFLIFITYNSFHH